MTDWRKRKKEVEKKGDERMLYYYDIEDVSPVTLKIKSLAVDEVFDQSQNKKTPLLCLEFEKAKKRLGLSASTNCDIIEAWHGRQVEGWVGKQITLRVAQMTSGPKKGDLCIRVDTPDGYKVPGKYPRFKYLDGE